MNAVELTTKAGELVGGDRAKQHGNKHDNFANIARFWSCYLDKELTPLDVGIMMALLKIARMESGELNEDDFIDCIGYVACAGEIALEQ
jgi:hypothetical protein